MQGNVESKQEGRLALLLEIEEKQLQYKQDRRPIFRYWTGMAVILIIAILSGIGAYFFNVFFLGVIAFVLGIAWIFLVSFFFPDVGFKGIEKIKDLLSLGKLIEILQGQLRLLEKYEEQQRSPRESYREELSETIIQYQRQANRYRRMHYTLQIFIILFSLFVTALTSGLTGLIGFIDKPWLPAFFSFLVSFLTGMITLFRFHDRGFNLQQTADAIEFEVKTADLRIFDYSPPLSDEEVLQKLSERGERLRDEQRKRQQQLEQASQNKQSSD